MSFPFQKCSLFWIRAIAKISYGLMIILLLTATSYVKVLQFPASINKDKPNEVVLSWTVENEQVVDKYLIYRKRSIDSGFHSEGKVASSHIRDYKFKDRHLYKSIIQIESVIYELNSIQDGSGVTLCQAGVNNSFNHCSANWGNIKSMFQ